MTGFSSTFAGEKREAAEEAAEVFAPEAGVCLYKLVLYTYTNIQKKNILYIYIYYILYVCVCI